MTKNFHHFISFLSVFILTCALFISPRVALASTPDCNISNWTPVSRNLTACVGGFDTVAELKRTTATINCLANSNFPNATTLGICRGISGATFSLSSTPDSNIAQDEAGKYYTCITGTNLNRAIGRLEVSFTNPSGYSCTTEEMVTRPADWDIATEGMPWNTGTNEVKNNLGNLECPGEKSINTALGCIPFELKGLSGALIGFLTGIAGGIAIIIMIIGTIQIMTGGNNPEQVKKGKELFTGAITGLLFIIFSVALLRIIASDIIKLPGF